MNPSRASVVKKLLTPMNRDKADGTSRRALDIKLTVLWGERGKIALGGGWKRTHCGPGRDGIVKVMDGARDYQQLWVVSWSFLCSGRIAQVIVDVWIYGYGDVACR